MKPGITLFAVLLVNSTGFTRAFAQELISVDVGAVVADTSRRQIGINTNYLVDDDDNRANALRGLADALREAGVRYLRYPGGEKSDGLLWSVWPYSTSMPTLARWAPQVPRYTTSEGRWRSIWRAVSIAASMSPTPVISQSTPSGMPSGNAASRSIAEEQR